MREGERQPVGDSRAEFAGVTVLTVAAHELKSPLALIRQLALELENTTDSQVATRIIEQIRLSAERSLRLTSNITKSSRLQMPLFDNEPIHPQRLVNDVVGELRPLYRARHKNLIAETKRGMPLVSANYDLLRQILCNFADNALHYSDSCERVLLQTHQNKRTHSVRFGVRDFGPAFSAKSWQNLHDIVAPTNHVSSRPESSGLGLIICNQFADAMGASIGLTHHRDGVSFYIDVPVSKQLSLL